MLLALGGFIEEYIPPVLTLGSALSWGSNSQGQLGNNSTIARSSPVSVTGGFTDWTQVSAGASHSLGVRANGTAWAWGLNDLFVSLLGDNTTVSKSSPVLIAGGFTDWTQVSAGQNHSLGLRENGTAWSWGFNTQGQLGDNSSVEKSSPVQVAGGFTDWIEVSAGGSHSLGLRENGTAWSWGNGQSGQLGNNYASGFPNKSSPVSVVGGFTDWIQLSTKNAANLGVRSNGTVWGWGGNFFGEIGDGTTINRSSPVLVVGGFTDWTKVSGGGAHSLGLRENGTAWAWGNGNNGRLGDNSSVDKSSPVQVAGGFTDWTQLSAGGSHGLGTR
jgi:alpha-tubulin suppressor-like RCC1 family protein